MIAPEHLGVLPTALRDQVQDIGDAPYLHDVGGGSHTYGEVYRESRRIAAALATLGIGPGDRVATMVASRALVVEVWLGIAWLRALDVGVGTSYRGDLLRHLLSDSGSRVLITERACMENVRDLEQFPAGLESVVLVDATTAEAKKAFPLGLGLEDLLSAEGLSEGAPDPQPWDPACITYTSGTTGPSKGVIVGWPQIYATGTGIFDLNFLDSTDVFYSPFPMNHIAARVNAHLMATVGGQVVMRPGFSVSNYWREVREYGCTVTNLGGAWRILDRQPPQDDDATVPLRQAFMVMSPGYDEFRKRFGNYRLRTGFSMTEVSMPLCCDDPPNPRTCGKPRVGPPGYEVRLVDEHDYPVPVGTVGEMVLRTSEPWTMSAGYFGLPEKTAEAWKNGWFHTGDFFTCDEDGYFYFMDRRKDAIRRRGENISSIEVEAVVDRHPAVAESAAIGIHSEAWGDEDLKIFVVCRDGLTLPPTDLIDFLQSRLPGFMVPRYIEFVDALPKTEATQRVMKAELRSRAVTAATWDREAPE